MKQLNKTVLLLIFLFITVLQPVKGESPIKPIAMPMGWIDNSTVKLRKTTPKSSQYYSFNIKSGELKELSMTKQKSAIPSGIKIREGAENITLSPDSLKVAYTFKNDLYTLNLITLKERRLTFDGSSSLLNGRASWVYYEEIFGRSTNYKAFWWSPDSKRVAFYQFDEEESPLFPIYHSEGQYGKLSYLHYPKAGDKNPKVKIGIVSLDSGEISWVDFNKERDQYFGEPFWAPNSNSLLVQWMDREQKNFVLYSVDALTGKKSTIYTEEQSTWVNWIEEVLFDKEMLYFVTDFEKWEQIYALDIKGGNVRRVTNGKNWSIKLLSLVPAEGKLFFSARRNNSLRNELYSVTTKGEGVVESYSTEQLNHSPIYIAPNGKFAVAVGSSLASPPKVVLIALGKQERRKQKGYRVIEDSRSDHFEQFTPLLPNLIYVTTKEGFKLPGAIILPKDFDSTHPYPVIVNIYGGPNSTNVMDRWKNPTTTTKLWWEKGVIQVWIDNRSSGHFGREGIDFVHRNLGHWELQDFMLWAKYFASLPYVDSGKIGITGFSYGGTMTLLALTSGEGLFSYGVAGAGVYDWMLYDTHYTERYMDTPQSNPEGYKSSSVLKKVSGYQSEKGAMLFLSHGTADDNVHLQNSMQLIDALQREKKEFQLMLYPGALHGYRGVQGLHFQNEVTNFWSKWLLEE